MKLFNAFKNLREKEELLQQGEIKRYLNEEETVLLTLSEDTAIVAGKGKIDKDLWTAITEELSLINYIIEIKENIQLPDDCSEMFQFFKKEINIYPNIDTSNVTDMESMFNGAILANPDTSGWSTSKVKSMMSMFERAFSANPDTSGWDVANVKRMNSMFYEAKAANPNTSNWNTANVTNMSYMFCRATLANPDTSKWDTTNVESMSAMFNEAKSANPDTSNWDVSKVVYMNEMFHEATSANPNTSNWDVSNVERMSYMFKGATVANPDTTNWDVCKVRSNDKMFEDSAYTGELLYGLGVNMMTKETCNKCGNEVIKDRKLDNNVWNCPNCGLEEYQSAGS